MYDYMKALHQRFFHEPEHAELRQAIEQTRREIRDQLEKAERKKLLYLVDSQSALKDEISLQSFVAGFQLAWGIAKELETDGLYSFEQDEEQQARKQAEQEVREHG